MQYKNKLAIAILAVFVLTELVASGRFLFAKEYHTIIWDITEALRIGIFAIFAFYLIPKRYLLARVLGLLTLFILPIVHIFEVLIPRIIYILKNNIEPVSGDQGIATSYDVSIAMAYIGLDYWIEITVFLTVFYIFNLLKPRKKEAVEYNENKCYLAVKPNPGWSGLLFSLLSCNSEKGQSSLVIKGKNYGFKNGIFVEKELGNVKSTYYLFDIDEAFAQQIKNKLMRKKWTILNNCLTKIYLPIKFKYG